MLVVGGAVVVVVVLVVVVGGVKTPIVMVTVLPVSTEAPDAGVCITTRWSSAGSSTATVCDAT